MTADKPLTIALFGPTASGKTQTAIEIARQFQGEIINLDSVQIYQELNIASAKPSMEERSAAVHHLIDIASPNQKLSTFEILEKATEKAFEILSRKKLPIFCGGTGLYFKALFYGLFEGPEAQPEIRKKIREEAAIRGIPFLHQQLQKIDPISAQRISQNDLVRIERALEVFEVTGKPLSVLHQTQTHTPPFRFLKIGVNFDRPELYQRINQRVDLMLSQGLMQEAETLWKKYPYSPVLASSIGYREMKEFLDGRLSLEETLILLKQNTRRFAKRQITLFNSFQETRWFIPPYLESILTWISQILQS